MSCQTPAILRFLLATSILDRFCAALCECVLGSDGPPCDVPGCIAWLESNNLFMIPLDNDRQWYRYHHLFRELLQRRLLAEVGPEQVTELHCRAAAWFAGQGLIDEALRHALAANDLDLAAELMVAGFCDVLNREDRPTLERWLHLLPEDFIERRPWLLVIKAYTFQFAWQLPAVWKLLDQIEALLDEGGEPAALHSYEHAPRSGGLHDLQALRGLIAGLRGQQAFTKSQADRAIACCEEAFALLPEGWRYVRGGTLMYWIMSMRAIGRSDAAYRTMIDQYESLPRKSDGYALRLLFTVCLNFLETGHLEQVGRTAQATLEQARSGRLMIIQGWVHYLLGMVHYCRNELDAATQHFEELVDKRYVVHVQSARNGMIGMARVHLAGAESPAAWRIMELLGQLDLERMGREGDDARSLRAQLEYFQGDTEAAFRWADAYTAPAPDRLLTWLQDPHLAKSHILLARGTDADLQSALDITDALNEIAQRTFSVRFQIEILALRALALEIARESRCGTRRVAASGGPRAARRHHPGLRRSGTAHADPAARPCPPGKALPLRPFAASWPHSLSLERRARPVMPDPGFTLPTPGSSNPSPTAELEVLALLRERLSNKEIAHRLGLSPATVKRHIANLYGKLGVNKRWDAVIKAEAFEILPPR